MKTLDFSVYEDRILGAWLGKSIGGTLGAYLENHKELKHLTADELWPATVPPNDDLDIQMVWLEALQEKGCHLTGDDLADFWQERCWYNFCDYGFFLHNLQRGIRPPVSGWWNNDFFCESEGCPIRSDIWGLVAAGNPALAAEMARQDGELDHVGFSVDAERFYAAMTAAAFFEKKRDRIIRAGLDVLPKDSELPGVVTTARQIAREIPSFDAAWRVLMRNFGDRDASKAVTNLAIVMLAWEKSDDDFAAAMTLCCNSGWDTDCTAGTLGAILGAWKGTACIPETWRNSLGPNLVCGVQIRHKNALLADVAHETALVGVEMSLTRNDQLRFRGAPEVPVRPAPAPSISLKAEYIEEPTLFSQETTYINLLIINELDKYTKGVLKIIAPEGIIVTPRQEVCVVEAHETAEVPLEIRRKDTAAPLPDKNLFRAVFATAETTVEHVFGLGGARQWLVYGPYWSMYDREKYGDECPYAGGDRNKNPFWAGCGPDTYQTYVFLDHPYLDEQRLAREDIPLEAPLHLESGTDLIDGEMLNGWRGAAVWYFTRTFTAPEGMEIDLNLGHTGQIRVWLDGAEVFCSHKNRLYTANAADSCLVKGTGKPQRLVVKLLSPEEQPTLGVHFIRARRASNIREGVSYLMDTLVDEIPACGYGW